MKKFYSLFLIGFMLVGLASSAFSQAPSPLIHYQFNETSDSLIVDNSGNGFDVFANCDTCWEAAGHLDGCFHFDGHRIPLPADDLEMTTEEGAIAFWMLLPDNGTAINVFFWGAEYGGNTFGGENEMHIHVEGEAGGVWAGGELSLFMRDSIAGSNYFLYSDPWDGGLGQAPSDQGILVDDSAWHHVAVTWGGSFGLYFDGEPIWDTTFYSPANIWDMNLMDIGMSRNNTGRALHGYMDEFRLYDVSLEAADIADIYNYTNVQEMKLDTRVSVYPNPATGNATFSFDAEGGKDISVNLFSITGGQVGNIFEGKSVQGLNKININTANYTPGVYFVKLNADNRSTYSKFVIK